MSLDRDQILAWLEQLGDADDKAVLDAARSLHAAIAESESDWDDLLVGEPAGAPEDDAEAESDWDDLLDGEAASAPEDDAESAAPELSADGVSAASLINKILSRSNLFDGTRQELEDFKAEIKEGSFDNGDVPYIRAMARRLGIK